MRILVVDDVAINRRIISMLAKRWGVESTEAASGVEALEILGGDSAFDLAILDMQMPEMDGAMLARKIRELPDCKKLPISFFTSVGADETRGQLVGLEIDLIEQKPVKPRTLLRVLTRARTGSDPQETEASTVNDYDQNLAEQLPLSILLADDNVVNQRVGTLMLQKLGYTVDCVNNGREAVEAVQKNMYDLVLMDAQMPEMDGFEATRHIRDNVSQDRQPRIVAMTAGVMKEDREKCYSVGMDDYISKPIAVENLVEILRRASETRDCTA